MWTRPLDGAWPIETVTKGLSVALDASAHAPLSLWLDRLTAWNEQIDLSAARSVEELVDLMIADAAVLSKRIPTGARVVDVGSGAGGLGLALALLRPDLSVTLIEPLLKRVVFLREVIAAVGRNDIAVEPMKVGVLPKRPIGERWDWAIARATLAPPAWLRAAESLIGPKGTVTVFLAKAEPPDEKKWRAVADESYVWPLTGMHRRQVDFQRRSVPAAC